MVRFVFRFLSMLALAIAVVFAVVDATRSIAASDWTLTPLGESWATAAPGSLEAARDFIETALLPFLWDPVMVFILSAPGFVVFAVLALIFYAAGHRREPAVRRLAPDR